MQLSIKNQKYYLRTKNSLILLILFELMCIWLWLLMKTLLRKIYLRESKFFPVVHGLMDTLYLGRKKTLRERSRCLPLLYMAILEERVSEYYVT